MDMAEAVFRDDKAAAVATQHWQKRQLHPYFGHMLAGKLQRNPFEDAGGGDRFTNMVRGRLSLSLFPTLLFPPSLVLAFSLSLSLARAFSHSFCLTAAAAAPSLRPHAGG
jgi:hypothetical protein